MANKVNNWKELLRLANEDLKKFNAELGVYEEDGEFSITIVIGDEETEYASGYYEDELSDLINDAWAHASAKSKSKKQTEIVAQRPAILAEIYNGMTDAEKDEFLRMTGNQ